MIDRLKTLPQYGLPQRAVTRAFGWLAKLRRPAFIKNVCIRLFIKKYRVDMSEALVSTPESYVDFNAFFTRVLRPELRPLGNNIISPVDGEISEIGKIHDRKIFQAKNHHYSLLSLLGNDSTLAAAFENGDYATLYLSPKDYHRIHMPISGQLKSMTHIPGKLFSVNQRTARNVPDLFARNERVVCIFETEKGKVAMILVGAMIVASIVTQWAGLVTPPRTRQVRRWTYDDVFIQKGEEMGYFQLGSTVIVLFQSNQIQWESHLKNGDGLKMGQMIGQ
ncbi:MAG: archaetidylserine decarboxylase [Gammaproteobacteria bacterium]|nr:archaetidylserine decarboxylase [Gammaproteobacteria bacterium]